MKSMYSAGGFLILLILASGCTTVKRYKTASYGGRDDSLVDMALFGASLSGPATEPSGRSLWDLSAGAQTHLIQIMDRRYSGNELFTGALNREYLREDLAPAADYTRKDLRMVFTITREKDYSVIRQAGGRYSPADRIEYLKFSLEISPGYNLDFTGWNHYATEYGEIEIADMSFSRNLGIEAEWSDKKASGTAKSTISRSEEQVISSRYLKLNGTISSRSLRVEMEGTRGIDLTGNVIADVSLAFEGFPERVAVPLYSDPAGSGIREVSALSFTDVMVPRMENAPETIMGTLELEYVYRHVKSGWKTFQEWDDRVTYFSGKVTKQIPLFEKHEYVPLLYCLGTDTGLKESIKVRIPTGREYLLQFRDFSDAGRFMDWLVISSEDPHGRSAGEPITVGDKALIFRGEPLTGSIISGDEHFKVMPVY